MFGGSSSMHGTLKELNEEITEYVEDNGGEEAVDSLNLYGTLYEVEGTVSFSVNQTIELELT